MYVFNLIDVFTTLNNVELTLSISTLVLTTMDNVETISLFWASSFATLINFKIRFWIWPFSKSWNEQKSIIEFQKKNMTYLINNPCSPSWSKESETWNVQCKNKPWKVWCIVHEKNVKITVWVCWWQNKLMYGLPLLVHIYTLLCV